MKKLFKILTCVFLSLMLIRSNTPLTTDAAMTATVNVPTAPESFYSMYQTNSSITLHWEGVVGSDTVIKFNVYKNGTLVNPSPINSFYYEVKGLEQNTAYTFTVKAVNTAGESAPSTAITVKTQNACFSYTTTNNGSILTLYTGNETNIVIPEVIGGNRVIAIGDNVFSNYPEVENLTIPSSVTSIGFNCFRNCNKLTIHAYSNSYAHTFATSQAIPFVSRDLFYTGDYAIGDGTIWNYCGYNIRIVIPNNLGVTKIGEYAFVDNFSLKSMTIPSGMTSIGANAFGYCFYLEDVLIPNSVTEIGEYAFNGCGKVTIHCDFGSYAHAYAINNGLAYALNNATELPVTIEGGFVFGITLGNTVSDLVSSFDVDVTMKDNLGNPITGSTLIGTGSVICFNGVNLSVVMKGEISGDGKIDAKDYLFAKRAFLQTYTLTEVQLKAACLESTALPTAKDYLKIKRHFMGTYDLYA